MAISKTVSVLALFITGSLINRALGPSGRGILAEMQTWVGLFIAIFGVSIDTVTYHFANKVTYREDDKSKFITIVILNVVFAFLATFALTLFVFYWPQQVSSKTVEFLFLLNIFLIISMITTNLMVFFQAIGNIKFSAMVGIVRAIISITIITMGYFFNAINIKFVIVSMLIVQAVALAMILQTALRERMIFGRFSKNMAIGLITKGLKYHIAMISLFVYTKVNQLIVFRYCGESQAGIFAVALTLAMYLMLIPETFQTALYPRVIHSNDDYEVTIKSLRFGFYIWGSIIFIIALFARPLLLIYGGNNFLSSVNVFRILMFATLFLPLSSLISPYYVKKGIFGIGSFLIAMLGIISIGMNLFLVPKYASIGAALATSITCLVGFCMALFLLYYLSGRNPLIAFKPVFKNEFYFLKQRYWYFIRKI